MNDSIRLASALRSTLQLVPRLDIEALKHELNLSIVEVDSDSFDGALLRAPDRLSGRILVRRGIREPGRKRFTIAHEVGHFILHGHEQRLSCGADEIEHWAERNPNPEHQADLFASELLLPSVSVQDQVAKNWPSIDLVGSIAEFFGASLTASARKYCDVIVQSCAVVWAEKGQIRWFHPSPKFAYWIAVGERVGVDTIAGRLFEGKGQPSGMVEVPAEEWITSKWLTNDAVISEQSLLLPQYDSCLSLLWVRHEIEQRPKDEDGLLEELDPSEFTLDRRNWPGKHRRR
jgi:IrrE N-terminal-like domain